MAIDTKAGRFVGTPLQRRYFRAMNSNLRRKLICALDTGSLDEAIETVRRVREHVGAFKIGHALTLPHGLSVVDRLRSEGAERIFLDLKFHDIPNSVGIGVREAAKRGVWMMTLHLSGGPAMIAASVEEANAFAEDTRPLLVGVSVLTSLGQDDLSRYLGVTRSLEDHMEVLSRMGVDAGLDGVVSSVEECARLKSALPGALVVTPGIRATGGEVGDQKRVGDGASALAAGADYLVLGRALAGADDPDEALASLGLGEDS
jgi:orotidine-5'-phosphate decarboxylase